MIILPHDFTKLKRSYVILYICLSDISYASNSESIIFQEHSKTQKPQRFLGFLFALIYTMVQAWFKLFKSFYCRLQSRCYVHVVMSYFEHDLFLYFRCRHAILFTFIQGGRYVKVYALHIDYFGSVPATGDAAIIGKTCCLYR